jgi:hypothetical protein
MKFATVASFSLVSGIIVYCFIMCRIKIKFSYSYYYSDETFRKFINFINCPLTENVWENLVYGTFNLYLPYVSSDGRGILTSMFGPQSGPHR